MWTGAWRTGVFLVILVTLWATAYKLKIWSPLVFPSPIEVKASLATGFREGTFQIGILASMKRILLGYALSIIMGLPLGIFLARFTWARQTLGQLILGLQTMPSICWLPLAILWFGLDEKAILFVVVMGSLFAVTTAIAAGLQTIPPAMIAAGQTLGASGLTLYRRVMLPAAFPPILTGLKLGWSFAWRSLMAGELLYSGVGLGRILQTGRDFGDMSQVIAAMLIIIAIGLLVENLFFRPFEARIQRRWGLART
jgi:NitT/TauT family transport system permease protein